MGWDKDGRYYTRSRKVNGRVVREYCGGGSIGQICADVDADRRVRREAERAAQKLEKSQLEAMEEDVQSFCKIADQVARAALLAVGYHCHKRGEWRRRRA
jgi:hypothetical protein